MEEVKNRFGKAVEIYKGVQRVDLNMLNKLVCYVDNYAIIDWLPKTFEGHKVEFIVVPRRGMNCGCD